MRAKEFINEESFGTSPKRKMREGGRHPRGHNPTTLYTIKDIEEDILDEHGKASKELCLSSKPDHKLGASMLSSCISQGFRSHNREREIRVGGPKGKRQSIKGKKIKGAKYGGPLPPNWEE